MRVTVVARIGRAGHLGRTTVPVAGFPGDACEQNADSGQVGKDLILTHVGVLRSGGVRGRLRRRYSPASKKYMIPTFTAASTRVIAQLALNDDGTPGSDHDFASLGAPRVRRHPGRLPDLMAAAIERRDIARVRNPERAQRERLSLASGCAR
jgi:hypothetical protein